VTASRFEVLFMSKGHRRAKSRFCIGHFREAAIKRARTTTLEVGKLANRFQESWGEGRLGRKMADRGHGSGL